MVSRWAWGCSAFTAGGLGSPAVSKSAPTYSRSLSSPSSDTMMCPAVIVWDADGIAVVKVIQNQNLGAEIQNVYTFRYLVLIPVSAFFQFFILEHSKNRLEDVQSQYPTAARFPLLSIGHWQTRTPEPRTSLLGQSQRTPAGTAPHLGSEPQTPRMAALSVRRHGMRARARLWFPMTNQVANTAHARSVAAAHSSLQPFGTFRPVSPCPNCSAVVHVYDLHNVVTYAVPSMPELPTLRLSDSAPTSRPAPK